jgi:hypothetical protein
LPPPVSDKTSWEKAAQGLFEATLRGARAGEQSYPEMELDTLEVSWAAVPVFQADGRVLADSKEPGATPFTTRAIFKRKREPTL